MLNKLILVIYKKKIILLGKVVHYQSLSSKFVTSGLLKCVRWQFYFENSSSNQVLELELSILQSIIL